MSRFNTGNPLGSADPRDRDDNSKNLDLAVNDLVNDQWQDRFGVMRWTWSGMDRAFDFAQDSRQSIFSASQEKRENDFNDAQSLRNEEFNQDQVERELRFNQFLASSGYQPIGDYEPGIVVTEYNQIFRYEGAFFRVKPSVDLPFTATDWATDSGDFIGLDDATLRQELSSANGGDIVSVTTSTGTQTVGEALDQRQIVFNSVSDMVEAVGLQVGARVRTLGYYSPGDGGGNDYEIVAADTGTDDGGSFIDLSGSGFQAKGLFLNDDINAAQFGFSVTGSANNNRDAIVSAIGFSEGNPVEVYAQQDFSLSSIEIESLPINLSFKGLGKIERYSGGRVATITYPLLDVLDVSSIEQESVTIDGNTQALDVLNVPDSSGYSRFDFIRVVSDDENPNGFSVNRKFGSVGVVAAVDTGKIYVSNPIEDKESMSTNIRVAKYQETKCKIKGLKTAGDIDAPNGQLVAVYGMLKPEIEADFDKHSHICFQPSGCVLGHFKISGRGKGDSAGSLGYLINEIGGYKNFYEKPTGSFFRHLFTTNYSPAEDLDPDIYNYGSAKDTVVWHGKSNGSSGAPWDDHPGARRTRFVECETTGMLNNGSSAREAYQLRGADTVIDGFVVDDSVTGLIRISSVAPLKTVHTVNGGRMPGVPILRTTSSIDTDQTFVLNELTWEGIDASRAFDFDANVEVIMNGGYYANKECKRNNVYILAARGECRFVLNKPHFVSGWDDGNTAIEAKVIGTFGTGETNIAGSASLEIIGSPQAWRAIVNSGNASTVCRLKISLTGNSPGAGNFVDGSFSVNKIAVSGSESFTNIVDFDDYMKNLGGI